MKSVYVDDLFQTFPLIFLFQDFYSDLKIFLALFHKVNLTSGGLETLSRKELEIYHRMPKEMIKIAPVLLLSALPFANYVVFPLA